MTDPEPVPDYVKRAVREIIEALANLRYEHVVNMTHGKRMSVQDIEWSIREYGCTVVDAGAAVEERIRAFLIRDTEPLRWAVIVPLFTKEQGWSDLSTEVTITQDASATGYAIELDSIHVL